jgi:preprotein translocase subunit Sss1
LDSTPNIPLPARSVSSTATGTNARYPNLQKYLRWAKAVALGQLLVVIVVSSSIFLISLVYHVSRRAAIQDAILPILEATAVSLLIGLAGYVVYVLTMAGIELVHVIVDIESNTRARQINPTEG